jgi:UDP-glucose 4-epimerase
MIVLVTGAAGPRGRQLVDALLAHGHEVVAVDREPWPNPPREVSFHDLDIRKRGFEELMRHRGVDAIVHLAVHAGFRLPPAERHRLNLEGTGRVLSLGREHDVSRVVIASHAAVYGALPDNPYFMDEDAPPRVGRAFPEMQDLVTADLLATNSMWKHPGLSVVVLRPVHAIGATARGALASMLRRTWFPTVVGYDPMIQVIHELDLAEAFATAVEPRVERGVYNVTGPGELPLSVLVREAGCRPVPVPEAVFGAVRGRFGMPQANAGAIDFLKHPCLIDGARFREQSGFTPAHGLRETATSPRP